MATIPKKTVMILGAGASYPYGFPLGGSLLQQICDQCDPTKHPEIAPLMQLLNLDPRQMEEMITLLRRGSVPSIDTLLEYQPDFTQVGKFAIAYGLIPCERAENLYDSTRGGDWYRYLWNHIRDRPERIGQNPLAILTFNYDRSLDYFLRAMLRDAFNISEPDAAKALEPIPIIHLHGLLGTLTDRPYVPTVNAHTIDLAIRSIQVIHESSLDSDPRFTQAHALLKEAERIMFLGFGYHEPNLRRLKLLDYGCVKAGTCKGMTAAETGLSKKLIADQMNFVNSDWDCLQFLRQFGWLHS